MNSRNCCLVTPRMEWASRRSRAALNSHAWISSSAVATARVSPSSLSGALLPPRRARRRVAVADLEPQRHALGLPLEVLGARFEAVPRIELHPETGERELGP